MIRAGGYAGTAAVTHLGIDHRLGRLTYAGGKADGSGIAGIFTGLTPDAAVGETALVDTGLDLPGGLFGVGKQRLGTHLGTGATEGAFILTEADLGKATVATGEDLGFTGVDTLIAAGADIGKFDICAAPGRADHLALAATEEVTAALVDAITHRFTCYQMEGLSPRLL